MEENIAIAQKRIRNYITRTPVMSSGILNEFLGNKIFFKMEALQKIGAFKARGAINTLLRLKEKGQLPDHVVTFSSGNHAQGVAWAAKTLGIKATILMDESSSSLKKQATKAYGAELIITKDRNAAEAGVEEYVQKGAYLIKPYAHPYVIQGQGTACYEALMDMQVDPDAIFTPCGGGGLASGTFLAAKELNSKAKLFFTEPETANDACKSVRDGNIFRFDSSPNTICDGVRTLGIADITFNYLKQFDGFFELSEEEIVYWTQWLIHLLKVNIEPSCALAMAGVFKWLRDNELKGQNILVIISGGNLSTEKQQEIWQKDYLAFEPRLNLSQAV
jgi:threonine dehydratase